MRHFQSQAPALKLIVAYKMAKGFLLVLLGILLVHEQMLGRVELFAQRTSEWVDARPALEGIGHHLAGWILRQATSQHIHFAIGLVIGDAISTWIEGVGLHFRQRWAAWWVVVATGALIPLELVELAKRLTALRVAVLVINVAIVAYLAGKVLYEQRTLDAH